MIFLFCECDPGVLPRRVLVPRQHFSHHQVPKKTKLYVDQSAREREQPVEMHRVFQRDLCKLRLSTARAYVKLLSEHGVGAVAAGVGFSQLRISAAVRGMGPEFQLAVSLTNSGPRAVQELGVVCEMNGSVYSCKRPLMHVPLLVGGLVSGVMFGRTSF